MSEGGDERRLASGATLDDVRRQNLRRVLRLAHTEGPMSRADITRATGLNRSTVGVLVGELQGRGLVEEHDAAPTRRVGRPSPQVVPAETTVVFAVNPEIDAIDLGVVALGGRVLHRVRYRTERTPSVTEVVNIVAAIAAGMTQSAAAQRTLGFALAVPGLVRAADGTVVLAPHLGWSDEPVAELLSRATGMPVVAGNDANCGVVAESTFGVARGPGVVVYLNGGASGIGSGITIDGQLLSGQSGHAGELGHTLVNSRGVRCHCGAVGCLETEVRRIRLLDALGGGDARADDESGSPLGEVLAREWARGRGDVRDEIARQLGFLGIAVRTIVNALNPRTIVLGGFLASLLDAVGADAVKDAVGRTLPGGLADVGVVSTSLGDEILLIGAAELLFAPVIDDPTSMPLAPEFVC